MPSNLPTSKLPTGQPSTLKPTQRIESPTNVPSSSPMARPTEGPTSSPTKRIDELKSYLVEVSPSSLDSLNDDRSDQYKAMEW